MELFLIGQEGVNDLAVFVLAPMASLCLGIMVPCGEMCQTMFGATNGCVVHLCPWFG